jgi:hypothetical protein
MKTKHYSPLFGVTFQYAATIFTDTFTGCSMRLLEQLFVMDTSQTNSRRPMENKDRRPCRGKSQGAKSNYVTGLVSVCFLGVARFCRAFFDTARREF